MGLAEIDNFLVSETPRAGGLAAIDDFLGQPPAPSTWRDRMFKTGQETLADPNATAIERFLAGLTGGMRAVPSPFRALPGPEASREEQLRDPIPGRIAELPMLPFSMAFSGLTKGLEEAGVISPRTTEQAEKSIVGSIPAFMAQPRIPRRTRAIEPLRAKEAIAEAPPIVRPIPEPGVPPTQPVEPPVPPVEVPRHPLPSTGATITPQAPDWFRRAWEAQTRDVPLQPEGPLGAPEPAMPDVIRRAIEPTKPAELPAVGVGDAVEYRARLSDQAVTGAVTNVNADGTVNIRARGGGILRNVEPEKVTPLRDPEPVGIESQKVGKRVALGEIDAEILGEMKQTVRDVQAEPTLGKRFTVDRSMESAEAAPSALEIKGYTTGKPSWMEIPDRPGQYYEYADVLKAIESLERGKWPGTARRQRIAEQLLQEVRFDAEAEKAKIAGYRAGVEEVAPSAERGAPSVGTETSAQEAFFGEVDRLAAEEAVAGQTASAIPQPIQKATGEKPTPPPGMVRLYHGTPWGFEGFDTRHATPSGLGGKGFYFTDEPQRADIYTGAGGPRGGGERAPNVQFIDVPRSSLADLSLLDKELPRGGDVDAILKSRGYAGTYNSMTGEYVIYDPNKFPPGPVPTVPQLGPIPAEIPAPIAAALPRPVEAARANIAQPEMFRGGEMIGPAVRPERIAPKVPQAAVGDQLLSALKPTVETQAGLPISEAWAKGDAVRYTPKPDQPGFAGRIVKVNKDGTVDIQAAAGGTVRKVDPGSGRVSRLAGVESRPGAVTLGSLGGALQEAAGYLPESIRTLNAKRLAFTQKGIDALVAKMPKVFREARGLGEEYVDIVHDRGATLANYIERGVELGGRMHHGLTEAERGRVDQVMRGGRTVNPAIQGLTDPARALANELQGKLIEQGYLTPEQVQLFAERFRSHPEYLRRLYETKLVPPDQPFLTGELTGPVGRGVKSEALMMRGDLQDVKLPLMGGEPLVGAQRADFLSPWLKKGYRLIKAEGDTVTLFRDIPEPIRKAMGEIRDKPGFVFAKTIAEQARIVANHEFLAKIAENPEWAKAGLTDAELLSGEWTRLTGDKKKWGPLADHFVKKDVALEIQNSIRIRQDWEKVIGRLVGLWKYGKVIVNPAAMGRNIISSAILADFGGLHPYMLDEWAKGANQIRKGDGVWPESKQIGLFKSGFAQNEILALSEGVARSTQPNWMLRMLDAVHEIAEAGRQKTGFSPSRIYAAIENFYRFNLYRYARETLNQSPKDARRYALKYAIDYEVVSPFVGALRGTGGGWAAPLAALGGAPFATFASKAIPLTLETLALHPIRVLKYPAIIYGISKMAGPMIGQSEEETAAQRELGGLNWLRYALIPRRDKDERSGYFDLGYTLPFGDLIEAVDAFSGGTGRRANISFLPLVGHPVAAIFEAVLNRSGFTGKDISAPSDTALQSLQKRIGHIYQSWAPSLAPPLPGLEKGGYGYEDLRRAFATPPETDFMGRTRSPVAAVLANLAGLRVKGVTTAELANFKAKQYEDMLDSLDREALQIVTKYRMNPEEANRRMEQLKQRAIQIATEAKEVFSLVPRGASRPAVPAPIQRAIGAGR